MGSASCTPHAAGVAEQVYAPDLDSGGVPVIGRTPRAGSNPAVRTSFYTITKDSLQAAIIYLTQDLR